MTPHEFKTAWTKIEDNLRTISLATLEKFKLNQLTKFFFRISGLPKDADPLLSFVGDTNRKNKYDSINLLTKWFDFLPADRSKYIAIGSDGCGDIIALNTEENCVVEWLDHEDDFSARFMNSSIIHLALCLIAYSQFVAAIKKENGHEAYSEANFSDTQFETLHAMLQSIDERSVTEGFWHTDLESLLIQRRSLT